MKRYLKDYSVLFGIAGVVLILDQITKTIIRSNLAMGEIWSPWEWLTPYARIVHWYNTGVAFGMFQGKAIIFTVLAFIVAILVIYYYPQIPKEDWYLRLALGLQLGGSLGNLVDRLLHNGQVTDFISVGNFPVFNIADSSITIGCCVLILGIWLEERKNKKSTKINDANIELHNVDGMD